MSTSAPHHSPTPDIDVEMEVEETQAEDEAEAPDGPDAETQAADTETNTAPTKKKRERKEPQPLAKEGGKSLFPFARVQRIIKADKDIPLMAREATFLISLATEEFIKRLCEAGHKQAEREKRSTVQYKDLANVVRKADEFLFLEEIIPPANAGPQLKRKPKAMEAKEGEGDSLPTMLDQFIVKPGEEGRTEPNFVMNEDGTMDGGDIEDLP